MSIYRFLPVFGGQLDASESRLRGELDDKFESKSAECPRQLPTTKSIVFTKNGTYYFADVDGSVRSKEDMGVIAEGYNFMSVEYLGRIIKDYDGVLETLSQLYRLDYVNNKGETLKKYLGTSVRPFTTDGAIDVSEFPARSAGTNSIDLISQNKTVRYDVNLNIVNVITDLYKTDEYNIWHIKHNGQRIDTGLDADTYNVFAAVSWVVSNFTAEEYAAAVGDTEQTGANGSTSRYGWNGLYDSLPDNLRYTDYITTTHPITKQYIRATRYSILARFPLTTARHDAAGYDNYICEMPPMTEIFDFDDQVTVNP